MHTVKLANQDQVNLQQLQEGLGLRSHLSDLSGVTGQNMKSSNQIVIPPEAMQASNSQAKNLDLTEANVLSS